MSGPSLAMVVTWLVATVWHSMPQAAHRTSPATMTEIEGTSVSRQPPAHTAVAASMKGKRPSLASRRPAIGEMAAPAR